MSRTTAARKGHETRRKFLRSFGNFAAALAAKETKFSIEQTKAMVIERTAKATGKREVITFNQAYGELSMWSKNTFKDVFDEDNSELGFSDLLTEAFLEGKTITTAKAVYTLWQRAEVVKERKSSENKNRLMREKGIEIRNDGAGVVKAEINDGVHITNDGRKIALTELTDGHLLAILPKMKFSKRRFQYVREALRRGFTAEVKATGMYSEHYERPVRSEAMEFAA